MNRSMLWAMRTVSAAAAAWAGAAQALCIAPVVPDPGFVCPPTVSGKEFSTLPDLNSLAVPTPLQTLHWIGGDAPGAVVVDGIDYAATTGLLPNRPADAQVDAMANTADHLFSVGKMVSDDKYYLLFNVANEPVIRWEAPKLALSSLWAGPLPPAFASAGIDALEVWGGDTPLGAVRDGTAIGGGLDADRFSLAGDPGGVAVFKLDGTALITTAMIGAAIDAPVHYWNDLDVDALMVGDFDRHLLFSIAPLGPYDGGEIWVWDTTKAKASFLAHGGHTWDTAFSPMITYGLGSEDVTVLEAVHIDAVPEPGTWALMALGAAGVLAARRRVSAQPQR